jgi:periplasmic nitrate reductase NapD
MNLSGILVEASPDYLDDVVVKLKALEGVEVHQIDKAGGRIVVVQEAADIHAEIESLKLIKAIPHVMLAEMAYHYIADDEKVYDELPPELGVAEGEAFAVPSFLRN